MKKNIKNIRNIAGFTLIELIVMVASSGAIFGLLLPAIQKIR